MKWRTHSAEGRQRRARDRHSRVHGESAMNVQTMLGMFHAQELFLVSVVRSMPPDARRRIADEFQTQVELAEAPHLASSHDRDTTEAFKAHIRKLSILLASLS
jgi:hypothetical protein